MLLYSHVCGSMLVAIQLDRQTRQPIAKDYQDKQLIKTYNQQKYWQPNKLRYHWYITNQNL